MLYDLIEKLCALPGVSGCEDAVREAILQQIRQDCTCKVDALGNLLAFKKGARRPGKTILLSAHMDEVGLIVTSVEENGLLRFATFGGIDKRTIVGRAVQIGKTPGVIGCKPVHMRTSEEKDKAVPLDGLYIDIGAKDREEALSLVSLGDRAVFISHYCEMGDGYLRGRALDDRIGCALLVELAKSPLPYDTWFAFTVQEETGCTGAITAAAQVCPEIGIAVETTTACDIPGVEEGRTVCKLQHGPVVSHMDRGTLYDMKLYARALEIAQARGIPCQTKEGVYGGNESRSVQVAGSGAQVLAVSVPCRYLHTPSCVAHRSDIGHTLALLQALVEELGA